eukprot:15317049-Alexandrium_andersonii.AAC.1
MIAHENVRGSSATTRFRHMADHRLCLDPENPRRVNFTSLFAPMLNRRTEIMDAWVRSCKSSA